MALLESPHTLRAPRQSRGARRLRAVLLVLLALALALPALPAQATTVVPISDDELVNGATAIVVVRVTAIQSVFDRATRRVFTDVTVAVDEVLFGDVPVRAVTVRLAGGRVGGFDVWVEGSPQFRQGERAVLFLRIGRDGRLSIMHLFQGKFSVVTDELTGEELAVRSADAGVDVIGRAGAARLATGDVRRLEDLRRVVRTLRRAGGPSAPATSAPASTGSGTVSESSGAFTYLGTPSRWFEPDSGQPITVMLDSAGEPAAATSGYSQVRDGYAAWSAVVGSAFSYRDGGFTSPRGYAFDGVNAISFRDPQGQIDPPSGCTGTLAMTVFYRSTSETRVVNGQSFYRILEADIVVADGWQGCGFYESYANLSEVMTHELGHVLGLGHSNDANATMYAFAHFDGRGASLTADDRAGLLSMYPAPSTLTVMRAGSGGGTVTSNPAGITCGSDCAQTYPLGTTVTLTAAPASGSVFAGWSGACSGTNGCTVTMNAARNVTATFTTTSLSVVFTSPAAGATVRGTTTVAFTASGGSGYSYQVTVDGSVAYAGTAASFAWNTTGVADGPHTLSVTVTDGSGRTATANRSVTVGNASPPSAFTARFSAPADGATVRYTLSVGMTTTAPWGQSKTFTLAVDGQVLTSRTITGTSVWYNWNTRTIADGSHQLTLTVTSNGTTANAAVTVNVANGGTVTPTPTPLTASFTAPGAGATVSGTTTIGMAASGASGAVAFTLRIDGTIVFEQTASGNTTSYAWNTLSAANGTRTLGLTVTDAAGRSATASRMVTVSNGTTPPPPTGFTAGFNAPTNGATVRYTLSVGMTTSAPWGQSKRFTLAVDGQVLTSQTITGTTLWYNWNTRTVPDGAHTLTLTVEYNGQTATATRSVTVDN